MNQIFGPVMFLYEANYTNLKNGKVDSQRKKREEKKLETRSGENH